MNHKKELHIINNFDTQVCRPNGSIEKYILVYDNKTPNSDCLVSTLRMYDVIKICQLLIITVIEGEIKLSVNGQKDIELKKNDFIYITADSVMSIQEISDNVKYQAVVLYPRLLRDVFTDLGKSYDVTEMSYKSEHRTCDEELMNYKRELYTELKQELHHNIPLKSLQLIARAYATIIVINDIERFKTDINEHKPVSRQENVFLKFMELLNVYADKQREVQFYAERLDITPKYLSAVSIEYSGKNASTWIDEYVTTKAKSLLRERKYAVREISELLNFTSQSFFGRYFKRIVGVSPRKFIENYTKEQ